METKIIFTVKYLNECLLVSVTEESSYTELITKLHDKWGDLLLGTFTCTCTAGDVKNVCLSSDGDLRNLVTLCQFSSIRIVSVEILHYNNSVIAPNIPEASNIPEVPPTQQTPTIPDELWTEAQVSNHQLQIVTNKRKPVMQQIKYSQSNNMPNYDVCPSIKKKPMLCDSWADIMKGGVGSIFKGGAADFRDQLIKYSTHMGFKFTYVRNDGKYIHVKCKEAVESNCRWLIKARWQPLTSYFEIHTANLIHDCVGKLVREDSRRIGRRMISSLVFNQVKNNPSITAKDIVGLIQDSYGFELPYWKAYKAVETAKSHIYGSYDDSYNQLRWYCRALLLTNPGSIADLETNPSSNRFERVFIAFKACMDGFKYCRPMLFLDGTFMKGRARGTLLAAIAKDGNNGLFPVCFAIVSAENSDNWKWFLEKIIDNVHHDSELCYISDRNKGLLNAFDELFQKPPNFYCLYHLKTNLRARFASGWIKESRDNLIDLFNQCAYAPTKRLFDDKLKEFIELGGNTAVNWIKSIEPHHKWAASYDTTVSRWGEMTSNAAESFNAWIKEARALPITYMIEKIRSDISRWYVERRKDCDGWNHPLVPTKDNWWHVMVDDGRSWFVTICPGGDFQVTSTPSVRVDLRTEECSCFQWKVTGFPCVHAVAVIRRYTSDMCSHVNQCFYTSTYKKCYEGDINPIPETLKYECQPSQQEPYILPPLLNQTPGRPRKERIPSCGEGKKGKKAAYKKRVSQGDVMNENQSEDVQQHP